MARLNAVCDSDEEFPDVATILRRSRTDVPKIPRKVLVKEHGNKVPLGYNDSMRIVEAAAAYEYHDNMSKPITEVSYKEKQSRRQRPLGAAQVNSLILPITDARLEKAENPGLKTITGSVHDVRQVRSSPRRTARQPINYRVFIPQGNASGSDDESYFDDLSDFVTDDSSESEMISTRSPKRSVPQTREVATPLPRKSHPFVIDDSTSDGENMPLQNPEEDYQRPSSKLKSLIEKPYLPVPSARNPLTEVIGLTSPAKAVPPVACSDDLSKRQSTTSEDGSSRDQHQDAVLQYFPPRSRSPHKILEGAQPITPPTSPSKPRLRSPSRGIRIPQSPHRPSIDAFWSQEVINDWNDQYSPKKTPNTSRRRKLFSATEDDEAASPSPGSPRRSPSKGSKIDKRAAKQQKAFNEKKYELATTFLNELDQIINDGKVSALASSAGGIHIIWSKKLNSTAGRANWRREAFKQKNTDGTVTTTSYLHHASIELAEKVIDDEERLINVIAHEYCHLANFMISGVKNNPHGKEFKAWARKCTAAFSHRNIHVTTKHSYAIAYKYIWACTSCGMEFKRHSKSIDPSRHSCGSCKNKLVQVQPAPRAANDGKMGGLSEYQKFMKVNFARLKRENEGLGQKEVMALVGRKFREMKAEKGEERSSGAEAVVVEDSKEEEGLRGEDEGVVDDVARKLDFLNLS